MFRSIRIGPIVKYSKRMQKFVFTKVHVININAGKIDIAYYRICNFNLCGPPELFVLVTYKLKNQLCEFQKKLHYIINAAIVCTIIESHGKII